MEGLPQNTSLLLEQSCSSSSKKISFGQKQNKSWLSTIFFAKVFVQEQEWIIIFNKYPSQIFSVEYIWYAGAFKVKVYFFWKYYKFLRKKNLVSSCEKLFDYVWLDGWATDDLVYKWKDVDPVQIVPGLHLPRFTLEQYKSAYCNVITNTGTNNSDYNYFLRSQET